MMRCHTLLLTAAAALAAFPVIASAFAPPTPRRQAIVRQCSPPHAVVRAHTPRSSTARRLLPTTTSSSSVNSAVPTPAAADEVAAGSSAAAATDATTLDADAAPTPAAPAPSGLSSSFLLLNAVAVIWGSQHVVIKTSLETLPPSALNLGRFATSCVLFLPAISTVLAAGNVKTLRAGAELGLWTALGFAFQSVGLLTTTASRSAFLLYLNVKIVPFLAWALLGRQVAASTWASALLALTGTALLSTDGGPVTVGDAWSVAAATASAMFILRLEAFAREHDAAQLNGVAFATVTALCAVWVGADLVVTDQPQQQGLATLLGTVLANPWPILYLGAFSTGLCNFLQTLGQRDIAAERAAIIYSMDPVYGAMFSYLFLHEGLGPQGFAGAAFVLLGVALSAMTTKTTEAPGNATAETAVAAATPTIVVANAAIDGDGAQHL